MTETGWVAGATFLAVAALTVAARGEDPDASAPLPPADASAPLPPAAASAPAAAAPSSTALAPAPTPASPPASPQPPRPRPFGAGTEVSVTAPDVHQVTIYVGRAIDLVDRPSDYDFVKVGRTPVTFELPPGNYWLEVESPDVTRGSRLLRVDQQPKHVMVHTGSSGLSGLATLSMAVGVAAALAATVVLASGSSGKTDFDKGKIVIPLYVSGGVLLGAGIGMYFASRTSVKEPEALTAGARSSPGLLIGALRRF